MTKPREWGFWTVGKLDMLRQYLPAFTKAAKFRARGVTQYLDLFAGQGGNVSRETGEELQNSAEIALDTRPELLRLRLFELDHAASLTRLLEGRFDTRDYVIIHGDSNEVLPEVLRNSGLETWAPTFAFIDPNGPDCWWSTLGTLATFKQRSKYKTELWMLFPVDMFTRFLRIDGGEVRPEDAERITRMFGSDEWVVIYESRLRGELEPREARAEYVNLMRWRLENELGYKWTHSFDVKTERRSIYSMIFATDNKAGNDIMSSIYESALSTFPRMRIEAWEQRTGQQSLFEDVPVAQVRYVHEAPLPPYGSKSRS